MGYAKSHMHDKREDETDDQMAPPHTWTHEQLLFASVRHTKVSIRAGHRSCSRLKSTRGINGEAVRLFAKVPQNDRARQIIARLFAKLPGPHH